MASLVQGQESVSWMRIGCVLAAGKREEQKLLTENIQSERVTMEGTQRVLSFTLIASSEMPRDLEQSESCVTPRQDDMVINVKLLTV